MPPSRSPNLPLVVRRASIGLVAGLLGGVMPAVTMTSLPGPVALLLGATLGALFSLTVTPTKGAYADTAISATALGVPLWGLINVIALPLLGGQTPNWTAEEMRAVFPALAGWILYGFFTGLALQLATDLALRFIGPEPSPEPTTSAKPRQILILGGGFAGVTTAESLEAEFGPDPAVAITLVSETNALLFTPMLAEVAGSSLEPTHITSPLRTGLKRTTVVRGSVVGIDVAARRVQIERGHDEPQLVLEYDELVLALGAVSNYLGNAGIERHSFDFKSIGNAIEIRNHVIDCFERADRESDAASRRRLVTFVIAGGGFAGVELAGALNDFARGMLAWYPNIPAEELQVVLVHSRDRILPELSEPLGRYALERMALRGVTFKLETRVQDARPGVVVLSPGKDRVEELPTETLVWTAGTTPNPVLKSLPLERDKRGAVIVAATLRSSSHSEIWALGDCASIPDVTATKEGATCPPTAQFALREARQLARNLRAVVRGLEPKPFRFKSLGALCVVGHHTACAEIRGLRFSGLFAWLMWRGIYLSKLPSLERKVRVLTDWAIELFFPRDIVQTVDLHERRRGA